MSTLAPLQEWLRWVWTDPRGVPSALKYPSVDRPEPLPRFFDQIAPGDPGPIRRLDVYANAYFERILGALAGDFPALRSVLGEKEFRHLTAEYLARHPSRTTNIDEVGQSLPAFLKTHPLSDKNPFLEDLARLEWELFLSIYTDSLPPFDPSAFARVPSDQWSTVSLVMDPALRVINTPWPVHQLWNRREDSDPLKNFPLTPQPIGIAVFWDSDGVWVQPLSLAETEALEGAKNGLPLGEMMNCMGSVSLAEVQNWFANWNQKGWVKGYAQRMDGSHF
jgi:hypothetical protein